LRREGIINDEIERTGNKAVVVYLKYFLGTQEENYIKLIGQQRIELGMSHYILIGFNDHLYTPLEVQVVTALSLISIIHKSLHAKSSPACSVLNSLSLSTVSNSADSSASVVSALPAV
jgi:hypothetical protein